ncbi:LADA_0A03796g1_1 [Lachancea dasiensis]|uniref:DASH complex subunit DUO1 n=1 Tax=Lachancea dasiensis TaxID=1072105 RepID=A0A1G4INQ5_9SACH|nr:LADA_0A03796g1_1 [Lachancea dasiensis]
MDIGDVDNSTMNKLIPEIFDQMRSNLSLAPSNSGFKPFVSAKAPSSMTTQSLLEESKGLDEIIPVIQKLEASLNTAGPQHLKRIRETCESSNRILDTWIRIQSQAGYAYDLMNDPSYVECITTTQNNDNLTPQMYLEQKQSQVLELKDLLEAKEQALRLKESEERQQLRNNERSYLQRGRKATNGTSRIPPSRSLMKKPSGIPRSTSRISKPVGRTGRASSRVTR